MHCSCSCIFAIPRCCGAKREKKEDSGREIATYNCCLCCWSRTNASMRIQSEAQCNPHTRLYLVPFSRKQASTGHCPSALCSLAQQHVREQPSSHRPAVWLSPRVKRLITSGPLPIPRYSHETPSTAPPATEQACERERDWREKEREINMGGDGGVIAAKREYMQSCGDVFGMKGGMAKTALNRTETAELRTKVS